MKNALYIGIQDGITDGVLESGLRLVQLTPQVVFESPGYRPYWVAEVTQDVWDNWKAFVGPSTVNYTGLNYSAWNQFWGTYVLGRIMSAEAWGKWKSEHLDTTERINLADVKKEAEKVK